MDNHCKIFECADLKFSGWSIDVIVIPWLQGFIVENHLVENHLWQWLAVVLTFVSTCTTELTALDEKPAV